MDFSFSVNFAFKVCFLFFKKVGVFGNKAEFGHFLKLFYKQCSVSADIMRDVFPRKTL